MVMMKFFCLESTISRDSR